MPTDLGSGLDDVKQRVLRAQSMATRLQDHIDLSLGDREGYVAFVSGGPEHPRLEIAPLDVTKILDAGIWSRRTAVLTSATIPPALTRGRRHARTGPSTSSTSAARSTTPSRRSSTARRTSPTRDRRCVTRPSHDEIAALIRAAGGRTLALFTSWKAMDAAAAAVR